MLHPERSKDPRSVARFEWEAMLLRRFQNPRIVRGIDHGFERGTHFMIMEYVDGNSLGQALSDVGITGPKFAGPVNKHLVFVNQNGNWVLQHDAAIALIQAATAMN